MAEQKQEKEITKEEKNKKLLETLDEKIEDCENRVKDAEMKAKQIHEDAELKSKAGDEEGAKFLLAEEAKLLELKKEIEDALEMAREQKEMLDNTLAMKDFLFKFKAAGDNVKKDEKK